MNSDNVILDVQSVLNNLEVGVIISENTDELTWIYATDSLFPLLGYTRDDMEKSYGNSLNDLIFPEDRLFCDKFIMEQLSVSNQYRVTYRIKRKFGKTIWILENGIRMVSNSDEEYIQRILRDITFEKKLEESLRISDRKFEIALDYADVTTYEYNVLNQTIVTTDEDFLIFGMPKGIELGLKAFGESGIIEDKSKKAFYETYSKIDKGEPFAKCILYTVDLEGRERIVEINLTTIYDSEGKAIRALGLRKDITEVSLQERENEYSKIITSKELLVYEVNLSKDLILEYNKDWAILLGCKAVNHYSKLKKFLVDKKIHNDDLESFDNFFSMENISRNFEMGERYLSIIFRSKTDGADYFWFKNNVHIVKDRFSDELIIRCYSDDITEQKLMELKAIDEKNFVASMINKAEEVYVVNLTKNKIISGHKGWVSLFGVNKTDDYSEMMLVFADRLIHPEDREIFKTAFSIGHILISYSKGETAFSKEYRRRNREGEYKWLRSSISIFEDATTSELKINAYVKDIHEEKLREIELIYNAEHDLLSGFYNKVYTEKHINDFLASHEGKRGEHAFLMLDLDFFKNINDTFGHAFGDDVISKTSSDIRELIRSDDIIGRIGGDEFVVFLKNVQNSKIASKKADQICKTCYETFMKNDTFHNLSVSIGLAFYSKDGKSYIDLYKKSDAALYISKKNGRNQFTIYDEKMLIQNSNINFIKKQKNSYGNGG